LYKFLVGLLMQPECVGNKWITAFLELDRCWYNIRWKREKWQRQG
jgi:hypothetical protein